MRSRRLAGSACKRVICLNSAVTHRRAAGRDMRVSQFKYWCFDWDGTLVDQRARYTAVHVDLVREMGGRPVSDYWTRRRSGQTEADLFEESGLPLALLRQYDGLREQRLEDPRYLRLDSLFPRVCGLLSFLQGVEATVWIITHRSEFDILGEQLRLLGLTHLIAGWKCTRSRVDASMENLLAFSPEAGMMATRAKADALSWFSRENPTVMVGDSPSDIRAAHRASTQAVALPTGLYGPQALQKANPDYCFRSIEALFAHLTSPNCERRR